MESYWLVDLLMVEGYQVHLANPSKVEQYWELKHGDDEHDAFGLAEILRMKILPEGFIYPKDQGPLRDLLGKRGHLVRLRTALIVSLQNILAKKVGAKMKTNHIKALRKYRVTRLLADDDDLCLAGRVSGDAIDSLTKQITAIEVGVEKRIDLKQLYDLLSSMHGLGRLLSSIIMLETGPINRLANAGSYVSYYSKVPAARFSNDKKKWTNNKELQQISVLSICKGGRACAAV